jgi:hypothetical protein
MTADRGEITEWFAAVCGPDGLPGWTAKRWGDAAKVAPSTITRLLKYPHDKKKAPTPKPDTLAKLARKAPIPAPWSLPPNFPAATDGGSNPSEDTSSIMVERENNRDNRSEGSPGNMRDRLIAQIVELLPVIPVDVLATVHGFMAIAPKHVPSERRGQKSRP